jgi:nicotinate-nucleotide pyrophosphorylase (carboxylating)
MPSATDSSSLAGPRWTPAIGQLIELALQEDLGRGDPTTESVGERGARTGRVVCREPVVVCGLKVAGWIIQRSQEPLDLEPLATEGQMLPAGAALARLSGPVDGILRVERTLLNFLMRLCGVASHTRQFVDAVQGTGARIADTRKTLPGWRALDKHAVLAGGGVNHRFDLGSGILLKDNHLVACGSVAEAVRRARALAPHPLRIEVEVESLEAAREALAAGAEALLLDNMTPDQIRQVRHQLGEEVLLEVSGGVTLHNVRAYAEAGPDIISVGALTHSARAVDLSLEL